MGTWGIRAFDNDDAEDWLQDLLENPDVGSIEAAFVDVIDAEDYLEAPQGQVAIAAAEVVAALQGRPDANSAREEIADLAFQPQSALITKAQEALDRVLSEPSELLELWQDSDDYDAWRQSVLELKARVSG